MCVYARARVLDQRMNIRYKNISKTKGYITPRSK